MPRILLLQVFFLITVSIACCSATEKNALPLPNIPVTEKSNIKRVDRNKNVDPQMTLFSAWLKNGDRVSSAKKVDKTIVRYIRGYWYGIHSQFKGNPAHYLYITGTRDSDNKMLYETTYQNDLNGNTQTLVCFKSDEEFQQELTRTETQHALLETTYNEQERRQLEAHAKMKATQANVSTCSVS